MNKIKQKLMGKKIAMLVVNDFRHDSRVLKEATSAKEAGMEVTVFARKSVDTPFTEEVDGIKIIRLQTCLDKFWSKVSKTGGREVAGSQSAGAPKSLVIYAAVINTWLINKMFYKEALKWSPDIVHANDTTSLQAGYWLKENGAKLVYDAHELYTEQLENPHPFWKSFFKGIEKKMNKVDGIFSVNQSILNELSTRYGVYKKPQAILYNTPYYVKINSTKAKKETKLLYLGHFMPGRGIEALTDSVDSIPNTKLYLYGNGFPVFGGNVKINKPVPPSQVVLEAKKYDIGILPYIGNTLNNRYSTPNKLFEYMMAGLAVVTSDLPEIAKIIKKEQNGLLYNPEDSETLIKKVEYLTSHPKILAKMKKNSLLAAKKFCWENQAVKQLKMYSKLIS